MSEITSDKPLARAGELLSDVKAGSEAGISLPLPHMTSGQDENSAAQDQLIVPQNTAEVPGSEPFVSMGKRVHNELTYRGVDWGMNSAFGATFTVLSERTEAGRRYWSEPITKGFEKILKPVLRTPGALKEGAKWGSRFMSIMVGGTVIIPVMVWLSRKDVEEKIVRKADQIIYGKDKVKDDPKFEESYLHIKEEPKKDFKTGMAARFMALTPLIALTVIPATNHWLTRKLYDPIGNMTKWAEKKLFMRKEPFVKIDSSKLSEQLSTRDFVHRTIGFDFGLTMFYSVLHEMAYKSLAALGMGKENPANATGTALPAHEVIADTAPVEKSNLHTSRVSQRKKPEPLPNGRYSDRELLEKAAPSPSLQP